MRLMAAHWLPVQTQTCHIPHHQALMYAFLNRQRMYRVEYGFHLQVSCLLVHVVLSALLVLVSY